METIQLALASDANYFPGLLVTAVSIARHASQDVSLVFNVLDGGIGDANLAFLRDRLGQAHPSISVRTYPVETAQFTEFPEWTSGSRMAYARLLMAELLQEEQFVLYCDVDFLWTADAAELWALRSQDYVLQACADGWCSTLDREAAWFALRGLAFDAKRYVCSGLLLVNLNRWREEKLGRKIMDFLHEHTDVLFVDQTAINAVVANIGLLPSKWGRFSREISARDLRGSWAIHYAGGAPWCANWWTSYITPSDILWYRVYGELVGRSARAVRKGFLAPWEYAKRRITYFLVHIPIIRTLFFVLLKLSGRGIYVPMLRGCRI